MLKIEQDIEADTMYLFLNSQKISHSVELQPDTIILDVTSDGRVVGIELRNVSTWPSNQMDAVPTSQPRGELMYVPA
jgi:uncharacterized protein YuzE